MGTLHRPDGTPRLVVIVGFSGSTQQILEDASFYVAPIPKWFDGIPNKTFVQAGQLRFDGTSRATRLMSGVPDALNPTHIELRFEVGGMGNLFSNGPWTTTDSGTIDAYLQNDDSITFTLRNRDKLSLPPIESHGVPR
jgi:hypothetical protein